MTTNEIDRLKYRRQYILSPVKLDCPFLHKKISLNDHILYYHPDLPFAEVKSETGNRRIIVLGDLFDYQDHEKDNQAILTDLINFDLQLFLKTCDNYAGRYVLIYTEEGSTHLVPDATAARKIYFTRQAGKTWCCSQPYLLGKVLGLNYSDDQEKKDFYNSSSFNWLNNSNIGNTTYFDEIKQVMPNYYFNLDNCQVIRHWPNKRIEYRSVKNVAEECSIIIKGLMKSICNRYSTMMPVTAGKDSRTLLAASRGLTDRIDYYVNKPESVKYTNLDISVPDKLFTKLGIEFHILDKFKDVDPEFKKIFFENMPLASEGLLPIIYNYYINYNDKVNLPGNMASAGFEIFRNRKIKVNAINLARLIHVDRFNYALDYLDKWIQETKDLSKRFNVHPINLFYWEERLGNWGTQTQLEKDIAQEELNLFNCRKLISLYLSVKPKYIEFPLFLLHKRIIKNLWSDTLQVPINPSSWNTILKILRRLGLLGLFFHLKDMLAKK